MHSRDMIHSTAFPCASLISSMNGPSTSIDTGYLSLHYLLMCLIDGVHYLCPYRRPRTSLVTSTDNANLHYKVTILPLLIPYYSSLSIERAQRETIAEGSYE